MFSSIKRLPTKTLAPRVPMTKAMVRRRAFATSHSWSSPYRDHFAFLVIPVSGDGVVASENRAAGTGVVVTQIRRCRRHEKNNREHHCCSGGQPDGLVNTHGKRFCTWSRSAHGQPHIYTWGSTASVDCISDSVKRVVRLQPGDRIHRARSSPSPPPPAEGSPT